MNVQLTSEELTKLANESAEGNIVMLKCNQRAEGPKKDASDTESGLNTSTAPSPNLQRRQYRLRNRAMKSQFASRNNQEANTAVSSKKEDPEISLTLLTLEE